MCFLMLKNAILPLKTPSSGTLKMNNQYLTVARPQAFALTNFTLQAADLGYGTCWIGAFDENRVKEILGVPAERKVVICMTFGTPDGRHVPKGRKAFEDFLFLNHYGRRWRHSDALKNGIG